MPVNYEIPPWIRGGNPLQAVEAGASLGQRIAESNQRAAFEFAQMQGQQAEFQQRMAMQQQQLEQQQAFQQQQFQADQTIQEQNQMRKDQQLAIENAYKQGQLGLKQQQLDMQIKAAAEQFQLQSNMQKQIAADTAVDVANGMDPEEARKKNTVKAYFDNAVQLGLTPQQIKALSDTSASKRWKMVDLPGNGLGIEQPSGTVTIYQRPPKAPAETEPKFEVRPSSIPGRPGRILHATGVSPSQLEQFGITNKYNFKGTNAPSQAAPYEDKTKLRNGNDLYEVRGGIPVLIQKNAFSDQKDQETQIPEHPSDE